MKLKAINEQNVMRCPNCNVFLVFDNNETVLTGSIKLPRIDLIKNNQDNSIQAFGRKKETAKKLGVKTELEAKTYLKNMTQIGYSLKEISKKTGIGVSTIFRYLKNNNIPEIKHKKHYRKPFNRRSFAEGEIRNIIVQIKNGVPFGVIGKQYNRTPN